MAGMIAWIILLLSKLFLEFLSIAHILESLKHYFSGVVVVQVLDLGPTNRCTHRTENSALKGVEGQAVVCRDPFCCHGSRWATSEWAALAAASGHLGCDWGGVMPHPAVGWMTPKLCNFLVKAETATFLVGQFWGVVLGVISENAARGHSSSPFNDFVSPQSLS